MLVSCFSGGGPLMPFDRSIYINNRLGRWLVQRYLKRYWLALCAGVRPNEVPSQAMEYLSLVPLTEKDYERMKDWAHTMGYGA